MLPSSTNTAPHNPKLSVAKRGVKRPFPPAAQTPARPALQLIHKPAAIAPDPALFAFIVVFVLPYCPRVWWPLYRRLRDDLLLDHEITFEAVTISLLYTVSAWGRRRLVLRYLGRVFHEIGVLEIHKIDPFMQSCAMLLAALGCDPGRGKVRYLVKPRFAIRRVKVALDPARRWGTVQQVSRSERHKRRNWFLDGCTAKK